VSVEYKGGSDMNVEDADEVVQVVHVKLDQALTSQ
jgi:hypothetical protein